MTTKRERSGNETDESGGDDDYLVGETSGPREGKRKVNRACDLCRKKKHRCDGDSSQAPCSTCKSLEVRCTYRDSSNRKAIPKGYVEALEARNATLLAIVAHDRPNVDLERLLGGPLVLDPAWFNVRRPAWQARTRIPPLGDLAPGSSSARPADGLKASAGPSSAAQSAGQDQSDHPKEKGDSEDELIRDFVRLDTPDDIVYRSYSGKSSSFPLVRSAIVFKYGANVANFISEMALHPLANEYLHQTPRWELPPDPTFLSGKSVYDIWPDPTLAFSLIDRYFAHPNEVIPLLQRAHFLREYTSGLYYRDEGFARICLLVFALGSGYTTDPRVLSIDEDGNYEGLASAGWIYYHAMSRIPNSPLYHTVLSDLQLAVLHASFLQLQGSKSNRAWPIIGAGLKAAVEVGAHRRGATRSKDPKENELMRRAFWCLYLLDAEYSCSFGRPLTLKEDEFDVELEFDDAFWHDGVEIQADGPPSDVHAFKLDVQLARIRGRTISLLYGIKRPPKSSLVIVGDLEEQIKDWQESIPPSLRWDPSRSDSLDFRLSAYLRISMEKTRTYIHRPFLPSPQHPVSASPSSITAAHQASLSSIAVYDDLYKKTQGRCQTLFFLPHGAATILLLTVWAGPATHEFANPAESMEAVEKVIWHLKHVVKRFIGARDAVVSKCVLAAPRIDYLVESAKKRQDRERRAAQASARHLQQRMHTVERLSHSPKSQSPPSAVPSATTSTSTSNITSPYEAGQASYQSGAAVQPTPDSQIATPLDMMDLFELGGDFMFPDLANDHDPAMTLFLSNPQQQQAPLPSSHPHHPHPQFDPTGQPYNFYGGGDPSWNSSGSHHSGGQR